MEEQQDGGTSPILAPAVATAWSARADQQGKKERKKATHKGSGESGAKKTSGKSPKEAARKQ
jgi:hypothetical protein